MTYRDIAASDSSDRLALTKEEAIEQLGEYRCRKMWHLEPNGEEVPTWRDLAEPEQSYFLTLVEGVVSQTRLIDAAVRDE